MLLLANDCVSVEVTDDCVHGSELAWLLWDFGDLMAIVLLKAPSSNFIAFSVKRSLFTTFTSFISFILRLFLMSQRDKQ